METPKISFVVPTRNRVQWLPECLSGLLMQTVKEIEVIVVHDRGGVEDDGTRALLDWYAKKDPRVVVIDGGDEQIGAGPARTIGAQAATAPIVGICDDDDVYPDERAQKILDWFEAHPESELVNAPYVSIGYNNQIIQGFRGEPFDEETFKKAGSVNYFCNPSAAGRRAALLAIPYKRETAEKTDDRQFIEDWIAAGKKIDFAPDDYLCMHRVLPNSMMADKRGFDPRWVRG